MRNRLGRPVGPSPNRSKRPWDPPYMQTKVKLALLTVAANPDLPRWLIADHLDISGSKLSTITCSKLGVAALAQLKSASQESLTPFVINEK